MPVVDNPDTPQAPSPDEHDPRRRGPATSDDCPSTTDDNAITPIADHVEASRRLPTLDEIKHHWPPTVDVPTAGSVFGLSRSHAYELVKRGQFPAKIIQIGGRYRVLTESIIRAVSDEPPTEPQS